LRRHRAQRRKKRDFAIILLKQRQFLDVLALVFGVIIRANGAKGVPVRLERGLETLRQVTKEANISLIGIGGFSIITGFLVLVFGAGDQTGAFYTLLLVGIVSILIGALTGE